MSEFITEGSAHASVGKGSRLSAIAPKVCAFGLCDIDAPSSMGPCGIVVGALPLSANPCAIVVAPRPNDIVDPITMGTPTPISAVAIPTISPPMLPTTVSDPVATFRQLTKPSGSIPVMGLLST